MFPKVCVHTHMHTHTHTHTYIYAEATHKCVTRAATLSTDVWSNG